MNNPEKVKKLTAFSQNWQTCDSIFNSFSEYLNLFINKL